MDQLVFFFFWVLVYSANVGHTYVTLYKSLVEVAGFWVMGGVGRSKHRYVNSRTVWDWEKTMREQETGEV